MQFNLKFSLKQGTGSKNSLISVIGNFWQKIYKFVFVFFLLSAAVFGAFVWQRSMSGGGWSDQRKQDYLNSQSNGVVFKEANFKKAFEDVQMRKQEGAYGQESIKDIFKAY